MDYKRMWDTLKAESGYRWCQPHPNSRELISIKELMDNMEQRVGSEETKNFYSHEYKKYCSCGRELEGSQSSDVDFGSFQTDVVAVWCENCGIVKCFKH